MFLLQPNFHILVILSSSFIIPHLLDSLPPYHLLISTPPHCKTATPYSFDLPLTARKLVPCSSSSYATHFFNSIGVELGGRSTVPTRNGHRETTYTSGYSSPMNEVIVEPLDLSREAFR
jgi:hypothetical protein